MKKILSLALITILLITSVFTGYVVSAEDTTETITNLAIKTDTFGNTLDYSIYPGYTIYKAADSSAWPYSTTVDPYTVNAVTSGAPKVLKDDWSWNRDSKWTAVVALNAGRSGEVGDNALRLGAPYATRTCGVIFTMRSNGELVLAKGSAIRVSFDVKVLTAAEDLTDDVAIHAGVVGSANALGYDYDSNGTIDDYENALISTPPQGGASYNLSNTTTGYSLKALGTDWTNVVFTTTADRHCNQMYIGLSTLNDAGAVVLIDNITVQKTNGENLFTATNVSSSSIYANHNVVPKIQEMLGTFDFAEGETVEETVDNSFTYLPLQYVHHSDATVAPTVSAAGLGVNGSYAMQMGVDANGTNTVSIKAYNEKSLSTWYWNKIYRVDVKVKVISGTVTNLKFALATDGRSATTGTYPSHDFFNASGKYYSPYTQTFAQIDGSDLSTKEYRKFSFFVYTNPYENQYRTLKITLNATAGTEILIDDLEAFDLDADTEIYVHANVKPTGISYMEHGKILNTDYKLVEFNTPITHTLPADAIVDAGVTKTLVNKTYVIVIPDANTSAKTVKDHLTVINPNVYGAGIKSMKYFTEMPQFNANFKSTTKNEVVTYTYNYSNIVVDTEVTDLENTMVATGHTYIVPHNGGGKDLKIFSNYYLAVKNDVNGDGLVNATDLVRAKRYVLNDETVGEASDAQLAAAGVTTDGAAITAAELLAIRADLMK